MKRLRRWGCFCLCLLLMLWAPETTVWGKVEEEDLQNPALVTEYHSAEEVSKMRSREYCDIVTNGMQMTVSGKTQKSYAGFFVCVRDKNGRNKFSQSQACGVPDADRTFIKTLDFSDCEKAEYIVSIKFIKSEGDTYNKDKPNMKGIPLRVTDQGVFIKEYTKIIKENQRIRSNDTSFTKCYLDTSMADMSYEIRNGAKWTKDAKKKLTSSEVKALKNFSDSIVKGASTKYGKLLKLHDYIAGHVYYDRPLFEGKTSSGTLNPYDLYKQIKNETSTKKAKTVCNGYSTLFAALARAQEIPCRTVSGHSISIPGNTWETEKNINKQDHVWNEAYVDGAWIIVDVTRDSSNVYQKNDDYPNGAYLAPEKEVLRYSGFDPSAQAQAVNHLYLGYREMPELSAKKPSLKKITDTVFPVTLKWSKADGAIGYEIYRAESSTGTDKLIKTIDSGKTVSCLDTSAVPKKKYYYKIRARDKNGLYTAKSSYRTVTSKMPVPKITSVKKSGNKVAVKWKKLSYISEYKVYRSTKATSGYVLLGTKESTAGSKTDCSSMKINGWKLAYKSIYLWTKIVLFVNILSRTTKSVAAVVSAGNRQRLLEIFKLWNPIAG